MSNNYPQNIKRCGYCKTKLIGHRKCRRCQILLHEGLEKPGWEDTLMADDKHHCTSCRDLIIAKTI